MRGRMKYKAVLALVYALVALSVSTCGGTPQSIPEPIPDIGATAQARLKEEREAEATVEANAQVIEGSVIEVVIPNASDKTTM